MLSILFGNSPYFSPLFPLLLVIFLYGSAGNALDFLWLSEFVDELTPDSQGPKSILFYNRIFCIYSRKNVRFKRSWHWGEHKYWYMYKYKQILLCPVSHSRTLAWSLTLAHSRIRWIPENISFKKKYGNSSKKCALKLVVVIWPGDEVPLC